MRILSFFAFASLLTHTAMGQDAAAGRWRVEGTGVPLPWDLELRGDASGKMFGAVSSCLSGRRPAEISELAVEGKTIRFKCTSGDGNRTITFEGHISGDEVSFTWRKDVRGEDPFPADKMFGSSAPPVFTANV